MGLTDLLQSVVNRDQKLEQMSKQLADIKGLREEFLRHHGFGMPGVAYDQEVDPEIF